MVTEHTFLRILETRANTAAAKPGCSVGQVGRKATCGPSATQPARRLATAARGAIRPHHFSYNPAISP